MEEWKSLAALRARRFLAYMYRRYPDINYSFLLPNLEEFWEALRELTNKGESSVKFTVAEWKADPEAKELAGKLLVHLGYLKQDGTYVFTKKQDKERQSYMNRVFEILNTSKDDMPSDIPKSPVKRKSPPNSPSLKKRKRRKLNSGDRKRPVINQRKTPNKILAKPAKVVELSDSDSDGVQVVDIQRRGGKPGGLQSLDLGGDSQDNLGLLGSQEKPIEIDCGVENEAPPAEARKAKPEPPAKAPKEKKMPKEESLSLPSDPLGEASETEEEEEMEIEPKDDPELPETQFSEPDLGMPDLGDAANESDPSKEPQKKASEPELPKEEGEKASSSEPSKEPGKKASKPEAPDKPGEGARDSMPGKLRNPFADAEKEKPEESEFPEAEVDQEQCKKNLGEAQAQDQPLGEEENGAEAEDEEQCLTYELSSRLSMDEARRLTVGDKVDLRDIVGRFLEAEVIAKGEGSLLKFHYTGWANKYDVEIDYMDCLHKIAKLDTRSRRSRSRLDHLKAGDPIDIFWENKWYAGKVKKLHFVKGTTEIQSSQVQVQFRPSLQTSTLKIHWFDLNDEQETFLHPQKTAPKPEPPKESPRKPGYGRKEKPKRFGSSFAFQSRLSRKPFGSKSGSSSASRKQKPIDEWVKVGEWVEVRKGPMWWRVAQCSEIKDGKYSFSGMYGNTQYLDGKVDGWKVRRPCDKYDLRKAKTMKVFEQKLQVVNKAWKIKRCRGDGNCLYRAWAEIRYGDQEEYGTVRKEVVKHVKKHARYFKQFIWDVSFKEKLKTMAEDGEWGDQFSLIALGEIYNVRFKVYEFMNGTATVSFENDFERDFKDLPMVYLARQRQIHYDLIVGESGSAHVKKLIDGDHLLKRRIERDKIEEAKEEERKKRREKEEAAARAKKMAELKEEARRKTGKDPGNLLAASDTEEDSDSIDLAGSRRKRKKRPKENEDPPKKEGDPPKQEGGPPKQDGLPLKKEGDSPNQGTGSSKPLPKNGLSRRKEKESPAGGGLGTWGGRSPGKEPEPSLDLSLDASQVDGLDEDMEANREEFGLSGSPRLRRKSNKERLGIGGKKKIGSFSEKPDHFSVKKKRPSVFSPGSDEEGSSGVLGLGVGKEQKSPSPAKRGAGPEEEVKSKDDPPEREDSGWACPACTFQNRPEALSCLVCLGERVKKTKYGWKCEYCTTVNNITDSRCSVCKKYRWRWQCCGTWYSSKETMHCPKCKQKRSGISRFPCGHDYDFSERKCPWCGKRNPWHKLVYEGGGNLEQSKLRGMKIPLHNPGRRRPSEGALRYDGIEFRNLDYEDGEFTPTGSFPGRDKIRWRDWLRAKEERDRHVYIIIPTAEDDCSQPCIGPAALPCKKKNVLTLTVANKDGSIYTTLTEKRRKHFVGEFLDLFDTLKAASLGAVCYILKNDSGYQYGKQEIVQDPLKPLKKPKRGKTKFTELIDKLMGLLEKHELTQEKIKELTKKPEKKNKSSKKRKHDGSGGNLNEPQQKKFRTGIFRGFEFPDPDDDDDQGPYIDSDSGNALGE